MEIVMLLKKCVKKDVRKGMPLDLIAKLDFELSDAVHYFGSN
jgi:hypothetical protein